MKAIFEFNLPEEKEEFDACTNGMNWALLVWELQEQIRKWKKYEKHTVPEVTVMDNVLYFISDQVEDKGLTFPS